MSMPINQGGWPNPFGITPGPRPGPSGSGAPPCTRLRPPRRFARPPGFLCGTWPLVVAPPVRRLHQVRAGYSAAPGPLTS